MIFAAIILVVFVLALRIPSALAGDRHHAYRQLRACARNAALRQQISQWEVSE